MCNNELVGIAVNYSGCEKSDPDIYMSVKGVVEWVRNHTVVSTTTEITTTKPSSTTTSHTVTPTTTQASTTSKVTLSIILNPIVVFTSIALVFRI